MNESEAPTKPEDSLSPFDEILVHECDQKALIRFKNGNRYVGRLSRGLLCGKGKYFWADGASYKVSATFSQRILTFHPH